MSVQNADRRVGPRPERIDLHAHSRCSDGTEAPADLVTAAAASGLDVVALTDHDTTAGWDEAARAAASCGMGLVRGIEVSCQHRGVSIHLLGYLHDPTEPGLLAELAETRHSRRSRARRMVAALAQDLSISYEDVLAQAATEASIGRPHIADALVARGVVASRDEAFATYLSTRSPYYATHYAPDVELVIRLVSEAGGVSVMAHPFAGRRGRTVGDGVVAAMVVAGLDGIEAHHRDHSADDVRRALTLAQRHGLLVTGSSDYHGTGKLNRLGERTTAPEVLQEIVRRASATPMIWPTS